MQLEFRRAKKEDLPTLVSMLADDQLGSTRENSTLPLHVGYINAFQNINKDNNNELIVALYEEKIVGMLQLTFIPYLTHMGSLRCLIEGVRVHQDYRNRGFGQNMFKLAIQKAKERGCSMVQLTSNKQREKAINFYETLGFVASHEGFKMSL